MFEESAEYNSSQAYGQSKLALVHFSRELQRRYAGEEQPAIVRHGFNDVGAALKRRAEALYSETTA